MNENYINLDIDDVGVKKELSTPYVTKISKTPNDTGCVKYCQLPQSIWITANGKEITTRTGEPGGKPIYTSTPGDIPYNTPPGSHIYERRERCNNLKKIECSTTAFCGWLGQQKPNGEWVGRCYPGTTEGPLDPLKTPNYEEKEIWIYGQPNPFVSM